MKRKLIPILLSAALLAAPGFYSQGQEVCKVEPDQTLRLYPEGQNIDKGLEGALGPLESNGFTKEETVDQWGSLTYIGDNARVDLYFPENPNGQRSGAPRGHSCHRCPERTRSGAGRRRSGHPAGRG